MTTIALRVTPTPGSIIMNQVHSLVRQLKWELLFMGIVTFIYHLGTLPAARTDEDAFRFILFDNGALPLPLQFIFMVFGAFWAFRIWEAFHAGDRSTFLSYHASRVTHQLLRMAAGAVVFVSIITFFWLLGATVSEIIVPGKSWFSDPEFSGPGWLVTLFGVLNAYLYATILALLFRKPEIWFLFWIPVTVSLFMYVIGRTGIDWLTDLLKGVLGWPLGVMAGFGFPSTRSPDPGMELPALGVLLLWTVIYAAGVYLVARIHRGD